MKILVVFMSFLSAAVFAATPYEISCGVTKQLTQSDYKLTASVKGMVTGTADEGFLLEDYTVKYTVYSTWDGKDEEGSKEEIKGRRLENDEKYSGTKYKDHVRFTLPSKVGKVELIYPAKLGNKKKFTAHLIFTYIDDHFGGTAHVHCKRTKAN